MKKKRNKIHFTPIVTDRFYNPVKKQKQSKQGRIYHYRLKGYAHWLLERIFGSWYDYRARQRMYDWMNAATSTGHIGSMTLFELERVVKKLEKML